MKTSEFIKQFNKLDVYYHELDTFFHIRAVQEEVFSHGVEINKYESGKDQTVARLPEDSNDWDFYGGSHFSPEMLELMLELAKTPPEEREDVQKYVILNGDPRHGTCYYFIIDDRDGRLIPNLATDASKLEKNASFSSEVLVKRKLALGPELAAAVDKLTVSLECAIELTEKSKHDDLD